MLIDMGVVEPAQVTTALARQGRIRARLGEILADAGVVDAPTLDRALADHLDLAYLDRLPPPDAEARALGALLPAEDALRLRAVPIGRAGGATLVATAAPDQLSALYDALPDALLPCRVCMAPAPEVEVRLSLIHGTELARLAEARPPRWLSARGWVAGRAGLLGLSLFIALLAGVIAAPSGMMQAATLAGLAVTAVNLALRLMALGALATAPQTVRTGPTDADDPLPRISLLVPLRDERGLVPSLLTRLSRLDYPRPLLDVLLVVEADDLPTRRALAAQDLPPWMRVVAVPDGSPRTKPRALNYALDFARAEIVGVYDAEDAPEADQLLRVADRFARDGPEVACLQGRLDYYNARHNWISRCFAIEYATWFRLLLPGLARMGAVVPLGGTTLFFRRGPLETVGAWDAHNVTEDADLGVRLARRGYRVELLDTTTHEEANAAVWPWIKQRSRWIKGYAMTWAVHTARPLALLRDLGPGRFIGFHALFLSAILGPLLLPFAWSTTVIAFGLPHPVTNGLPGWAPPALAYAMLSLAALDMTVCWIGCRARAHRHLWLWAPTMQFYFPLATLAAIKALKELATSPFHWDKTRHGAFGGRRGH